MDTAVDLKFADGEYHFALLLPQIFELERNCGGPDAEGVRRGKSIFQIYDELSAGLGLSVDGDAVFMGGGKAHAKDIRECVRLGLIGGGATPIDAKQLVDDYCFPARPIAECLGVAWAILRAAIEGVEIKKKVAVTSESEAAQNPSEKAA
jgi:hypothetical protein